MTKKFKIMLVIGLGWVLSLSTNSAQATNENNEENNIKQVSKINFNDLPSDNIGEIFKLSNLTDPVEVIELGTVCKQWNNLINDKNSFIYKHILETIFTQSLSVIDWSISTNDFSSNYKLLKNNSHVKHLTILSYTENERGSYKYIELNQGMLRTQARHDHNRCIHFLRTIAEKALENKPNLKSIKIIGDIYPDFFTKSSNPFPFFKDLEELTIEGKIIAYRKNIDDKGYFTYSLISSMPKLKFVKSNNFNYTNPNYQQ